MEKEFQKKISRLGGLLFMSFAWAITGCRQISSECSSCKNLPPNSQSEISIAGKNYTAKIWKGHRNYQFAHVETNSEMLSNSLNLCGHSLNSGEELAATVFYVSGLPKKDVPLLKKDVLGYGMYFLKEHKLRYRFYLKSDNQFQIIPELNCEVKAMSSNDIYNISDLYFGTQDVCALSITCPAILLKPNVSKSHTLGYNIDYLYRKITPQVNGKVTAVPTNPNCEPPCTGGDNGCEYTLHGWSCDHTTTAENDAAQASALARDGAVAQNVIDDAYNVTLHYSFRDSFLLKHQLTQKYVDYYYGMTPDAYLTSDILSRMPGYLQQVNIKAIQLLKNQSDIILIDQPFKDETVAILKLYESAAPSDKELAYFLDIEKDVNFYAGKRIGEIVCSLD